MGTRRGKRCPFPAQKRENCYTSCAGARPLPWTLPPLSLTEMPWQSPGPKAPQEESMDPWELSTAHLMQGPNPPGPPSGASPGSRASRRRRKQVNRNTGPEPQHGWQRRTGAPEATGHWSGRPASVSWRPGPCDLAVVLPHSAHVPGADSSGGQCGGARGRRPRPAAALPCSTVCTAATHCPWDWHRWATQGQGPPGDGSQLSSAL